MKLIDLLVQELPKRGGWPEGVKDISQDYDGQVWYDHDGSVDKFPLIAEDCRKWGSGNSNEVTRKQYEAALAASQPPVWDGKGLPPVGCECEIMARNYDLAAWLKFSIFFVKGECLFGETESGTPVAFNINDEDGYYLRPIRTEAARKREESSAQMLNIFMNSELFTGKECNEKAMQAVYDAIAAGKIPGIKVEG